MVESNLKQYTLNFQRPAYLFSVFTGLTGLPADAVEPKIEHEGSRTYYEFEDYGIGLSSFRIEDDTDWRGVFAQDIGVISYHGLDRRIEALYESFGRGEQKSIQSDPVHVDFDVFSG